MNVQDIMMLIDAIAPFSSQEEWDNSGLLIGAPYDPVQNILFALDVTDPVIHEAIMRNASLIVTHHPLMFSPRRRITEDDMEGRLIRQLIRHGISLISAHTNLDRAPGGVNDALALQCGLLNISGEGFFRNGSLPELLTVRDYADQLASSLSCAVRIMGPSDRIVTRVGVSSGSGGDLWAEAVEAGCNVFITGEMKHHIALSAADAGLVVLECGHYATEYPGICALAETLQKTLNQLQCNLGIYLSEVPAYSFFQQP